MSKRWVWFLLLACSLSTSAMSAVIPADIYVTTNADSGAGSLRWAVGISNTTTGVQTIGFSVGNSITVLSRIDVTAPAVINGDNNQVIGALGTGTASILYFSSASAGSTLTGCALVNSNYAVEFDANNSLIKDCRVGVDYSGTARPNQYGIYMHDHSNNTVQNCIVGGGNNNGIRFIRMASSRIVGCHVGLLPDGTPRGNTAGINLYECRSCLVGGNSSDSLQRNVISGNGTGIIVQNLAFGNTLCGNVIGLNPAMSAAVPNNNGIHLASRAYGNYIGLPQANYGNVIAGNSTAGIYAYESVISSKPENMIIQNNLIGLNPSGTVFANGTGIFLVNADGFRIGGSLSASAREANVISGNSADALLLSGKGNTISGNYIGTDATGYSGVGNGGYGIWMGNVLAGSNTITCSGNLIGGDKATNQGNVICSNGADGISLEEAANNEISGNLIGLAVNSAPLPNGGYGIGLDQAIGNRIGRPDADYGNVISGQPDSGIYLMGGSDGNTVCGNIVGLARQQGSAIPNATGIYLSNSHYNTIGLPTGTYGYNVIAGNTYEGIMLSFAHNNRIQNNFIGLSSGNAAFGNNFGVSINQGFGNLVGGNRLANEGNIISGNTNDGVLIDAGAGNTICGNTIGLSSTQTQARGNGSSGIILGANADTHHNAVGLPQAGYGNVICANDVGVYFGTDADENTVQNNVIGLNAAGESFPNASQGLYISRAEKNLIGGPGAGNIISSNTGYAIYLNASPNNTVSANTINLNAAGNSLLANYAETAAIGLNDSYGNFIGGYGSNGNRICGRNLGIEVSGSAGNTVVGNTFGRFANGQPTEASFATTVHFTNGSHHNMLGEYEQGNQITGGGVGVWGDDSGVYRNGFYRNLISGQSTKPILLTNGSNQYKEAPVITSAYGQTITGQTQMAGDVVEVFQAEASSNTYTSGGSLKFLGRLVAPGSASPAPWTLVVPSVGGEWVCATSSDINHNTSEFSFNVLNTGPTATPTVTPVVTPTSTATPVEITSTPTPIQIDWKGAKVLAFPNPAKGQMTFAAQVPEAGKLTIALYNLSGERVASLQESVAAGTAMLVWDCSGTAPGVYVVRIMVNNRELTKLKVAVLK